MKKTTLLLAGILIALSATTACVFAKDPSHDTVGQTQTCEQNPLQEHCPKK